MGMSGVLRKLVTEISFRVDDTNLKKAGASLTRFGKKARAVGASLSMQLTAPILFAGVSILKVAGDFQTAMNRVAVLTEATTREFKILEKQAKHLGATTAFSATEAADAMGFLAQAGFKATEIFAAMPATLNLAAAAKQSLAETADQLSNVMQGFGLSADMAGRASDVLARAASSTNTNVAQLAEGMSYAAPVAKLLGMSLEQAAGEMGFMGNAGIQASMAGTALRQALLSTVAQTPRAKKAFEDLGISLKETLEDGTEQTRNFIEILADLGRAGASTEQLEAIFGARGIAGVGAVLQQTTPELKKLITELENSGGTAAKQAKKQLEGYNGALIQLRSTIEAFAIMLADTGLLNWATEMLKKITEFVRALKSMNPETLKTITIIAGVVAAIGPLTIAVGLLSTALGGVVSVVTFLFAHPIVLVITAVIAAIIKFRKEIWNTIKNIWTWIKNVVTSAKFLLINMVTNVLLFIGKSASLINEQFHKGLSAAINFGIKGVNKVIKMLNVIPGVDLGDIQDVVITYDQTSFGKGVKELETGIEKITDELMNKLAHAPDPFSYVPISEKKENPKKTASSAGSSSTPAIDKIQQVLISGARSSVSPLSYAEISGRDIRGRDNIVHVKSDITVNISGQASDPMTIEKMRSRIKDTVEGVFNNVVRQTMFNNPEVVQ